MKAEKHLTDPSSRSLYKPDSGALAETVVFVTLGLVGLVAVLIAIGAASLPPGSKENRVVEYLRSGQISSDARYVAAIVRYLLEPDPEPENPAFTDMPAITLTIIPPNKTFWRGNMTLEFFVQDDVRASSQVSDDLLQ